MRRPAQHRTTPAPMAWAHPYTGASALAVFYNDGGQGNPTPTPPAPAPAPEPPKPAPPAARTFTQEEVEALAAKEKAQGKRSAAKEFAEKHGFGSIEDAETFIAAARQAQDDALSAQEKRDKELAAREARAEEREKAAETRERAANRRAVLVGLGATGDDLEDAAALLRVADDADDTAVSEAAEKLKARRPELFGVTPSPDPTAKTMPPAPGGAPAGGPPARQNPTGKPGDRGRAIAQARGHRTAA